MIHYGIAKLAEGFIQPQGKFVLLLGDNLFEDPLEPYVTAFENQEKEAMVLLKEVVDKQGFGVPELDGSKIRRIMEKPAGTPFHDPEAGFDWSTKFE